MAFAKAKAGITFADIFRKYTKKKYSKREKQWRQGKMASGGRGRRGKKIVRWRREGRGWKNLIFAILCIVVFDWRRISREIRERVYRSAYSFLRLSEHSTEQPELLWQVRKLWRLRGLVIKGERRCTCRCRVFVAQLKLSVAVA